MKYRYLGASGLLVSRISLGTMTFGTPDWGCDEKESHAIIKRYLENGGNFIDHFDTNSFLYLAKALDLYDVAWNFDSLEDALEGIVAPSLWLAFTSDWLYPPYQTEEVVESLKNLNKTVDYHLIQSDYGHDSFLVEPEKFIPLAEAFLNRVDS